MLIEHINAALRQAHYEILDDDTIYAEIPELPGVYANALTVEECRSELQSVIEEWIVLGLRLGHAFPTVGGVTLAVHLEPA